MSAGAAPLRVGVVSDYIEEAWPSMDLVSAMLLETLHHEHEHEVSATRIRPPLKARFRRAPFSGRSRVAFNADRLLGRFIDYPRCLRTAGEPMDLYHIVDHSYAHLVHAVPRGSAVVTCHDLDTFRSVLEPAREPRGPAFRAMTRRILTGLQRAAFVTCDSVATYDAIVAHELVPRDRLAVVPLGVSQVMSPIADPVADAAVAAFLGPTGGRTDLLHVGSTIPRKRIDVLLRVVATVRADLPEVRLVRCGGPLTAAQQELARHLGLERDAVITLPYLQPPELAAVYRRAAVVLQPSEAEGFGLPVVEAMACGAPVIASDLEVLREVGGSAARYCPVGDVAAWHRTVLDLLRDNEPGTRPWSVRRTESLRQAASFSWSRFGDRVVEIYRRVAAESRAGATA